MSEREYIITKLYKHIMRFCRYRIPMFVHDSTLLIILFISSVGNLIIKINTYNENKIASQLVINF